MQKVIRAVRRRWRHSLKRALGLVDKPQVSPWWALDIFPWRAVNVGVDSDPYAAWAPSYPPRAHNALMHVEEKAVTGLLPDVSGCTVLDAGSGTGRYVRLLNDRGATRVVGVDSSMAMLRRADSCGMAHPR